MIREPISPKNLWKHMLNNKHLLKYQNGVTIPFIVGAYYIRGMLNENDLKTEYCIQYILANINDTIQPDKKIAIFKCGLNKKLILQYITEGQRTNKEIESIKRNHYSINNVIFLDFDIFKHSYTLETLSNKLWDYYKVPIVNHTFSYQQGKWSSFNNEEVDFIDNLNNNLL